MAAAYGTAGGGRPSAAYRLAAAGRQSSADSAASQHRRGAGWWNHYEAAGDYERARRDAAANASAAGVSRSSATLPSHSHAHVHAKPAGGQYFWQQPAVDKPQHAPGTTYRYMRHGQLSSRPFPTDAPDGRAKTHSRPLGYGKPIIGNKLDGEAGGNGTLIFTNGVAITGKGRPKRQGTKVEPLIWTVDAAHSSTEMANTSTAAASGGRPTVLVRKPRARRLARALFCCFGAKVNRASDRRPPARQPPAGCYALPQVSASGPNGGATAGNGSKPAPSPATAVTNGNGLAPPGNQPNAHYSPKPHEKLLLAQLRPGDANKKCLIIDLDETLVHSSFKPVKNPDFVIPVEIDGVIHQVYVLKRPHVDEFLQRIGHLFECILFTASLAKYADPVADLLDKWSVFRARLFREACVFHKGNYVKDLNRLGRDLKRVIIIDNSPASYAFHPENAIPVASWFDDAGDHELLDIVPLLERLAGAADIFPVLRQAMEGRHLAAGQPPPAAVADHRLAGATHGEDAIFSTGSSIIASAPRPVGVQVAPAAAAAGPPKYEITAR